MIKFDGRIVQFGFGAVGKSFYEKVSNEIKFDESKYFVITRYVNEFEAYINLGGLTSNFVTCEITRDNFRSMFEQYLGESDLLLDFADTVGTKDICDWCATKNIMYINTGAADWPENWLNIFEQDKYLQDVKDFHKQDYSTNKHPIVLQHGNNPGLVSHFVKAGIEHIVHTQFKHNKQLKRLIKQAKFNEAAQILGIKMVQVNDIDLQKIKDSYSEDKLFNTWCIDAFLFEALSESTFNIGSHEKIDFEEECKFIDLANGFLEFEKLAAEKLCRAYCPSGAFKGFLVPHEETITIARGLEVKRDGKMIYRPSVMFVYQPCCLAKKYLETAKVNEYPHPNPEKPLDCENEIGPSIIRGHKYPRYAEIVYHEKLLSGTEYVGVLLIGDNFEPVWVGNRVEPSFLYKKKKGSYWQTPTITPVAMSALAVTCWMIKNKDKKGIYFPDDIKEYKDILKIAEKYISKTIYQTVDKKELEKTLKLDFDKIQAKDFFVI